MLKTMKIEYPEAYFTVCQIADYFKNQWGWTCDEDEKLYLLIYVSRLTTKY